MEWVKRDDYYDLMAGDLSLLSASYDYFWYLFPIWDQRKEFYSLDAMNKFLKSVDLPVLVETKEDL